MKKQYWLMKSEPSEFSINDLEFKKEAFWDGVRNYQVRNMFRDLMKVGDKALFYHSSTTEVGVIGEMKISKEACSDPTQFDPKSKYFDPEADLNNPRWLGPTVFFVKKFNNLVSLQTLKQDDLFSDLPLVKKGSRLSVMPINKKQFDKICRLGK